MIWYWATPAWLNTFMARHAGSVTHMICITRFAPASAAEEKKNEQTCKHKLVTYTRYQTFVLMQPRCWFQKPTHHEKEPHHAPPWYICWRGEKVGAVYYWTRWRIDPPVFGGLAVLLSALSFPQHQSRWLQLLTDQSRNRLVSRRREGLWPQTPHTGRPGFPYQAEQIGCRDAVVSDYRGRGGRGWEVGS